MKKILIVDDSQIARDSFPDIISLMAPNEFEFITAKDGQEALEIIINESNSEQIYALITDFNMPRMTGGELVREIIKREISINCTEGFRAKYKKEAKKYFFDESPRLQKK